MILTIGLISLALGEAPLHAGDTGKAAPKRVVVGRRVSTEGLPVRREGPEKPWQILKEKESVNSGDLVIGASGSEIESANGAVRLHLLSDLSGESPYPVREAAVVLRANPTVDLELTLDRGRVDLVNHKEKGPASVRIHVRDASWDLTLLEPEARIALELYGRWPRGVLFTPKPGSKEGPTADLVFLVLKGQVRMKYQNREHLLTAPPGPSLIEWDSVNGLDETPQRLEALPAWATPATNDTPLAKEKLAAWARLRARAADRPIGDVLDEFVNSDNVADRRLAINAMAALDDLPRLARAMAEAKHPDVWENGVLAMRHWIGRGPGQDQLLYKALIEGRKFSPVHAETVMQLLHSYGETELADADTYQVLIDYLGHEKLSIRALAYWHLSRLVPAGKKFGYDPLAPKEARAEAIRQWRTLLPSGKMPPRPTASDGK